tara:strand:- start:31099 stop:31902 length:804 start_codon:yes stop_codon:yes gene_type:complete
MIAFRSTIFNILFYLNLIIQMIIFSPFYFLAPQKTAWSVPKNWVRSNHWLLEKVVGTKLVVEGLENIPQGGYIIAPKHQSFWDAYALLPYLDNPFYILKRELLWIPLFGWYVAKMNMVPVNRGSKAKVMPIVMSRTKKQMATGRQLIIYPEGTRRPAGAEAAYKFGIGKIYSELDVPVVPVAMVPGLFWPRRKFLRYPGTIKVRFLPAIQPGLGASTFMKTLVRETETACDELLVEAIRDNPDLPISDLARNRFKELTGSVPSNDSI